REPDRGVRAGPAVEDPPSSGDDPARHRANDRPDRGQHLPGRALARAAVLQPAGARLGPLPDPDPRPLALRLVDPPGRRDHGRQRPNRGAGAPALEGEAAVSGPRPEPKWDVVIIGAGHNALITAAYVARTGLRTLVLERRDRVGGAADTTQLARGIRVPALAHTVGRLRPSVQKDLELSRQGLSLVAPDVRVFAPQPDGSAITLLGDAE